MNTLVTAIHSMSFNWFLACVVLCMILAVILMITCFTNLTIARDIANTPSSKIRSAAQGFVEIQGVATPVSAPLIAPLTGKPCCWYRYDIEREVSVQNDDGSTSTEWETVDSGDSTRLFLITDPTGVCLVNATHAKVSPTIKETWRGPSLLGSVSANQASASRWQTILAQLGGERYQYTEYRIEPNESMFVLGYFKTEQPAINPFRKVKAEDYFAKASGQASHQSKMHSLLKRYTDLIMADLNTQIHQSADDWDVHAQSISPGESINYLRYDPQQAFIISAQSPRKTIIKYQLASGFSAFGVFASLLSLAALVFFR